MVTDEVNANNVISIHAPREGGDGRRRITGGRTIEISIHAPREGGDGAERA